MMNEDFSCGTFSASFTGRETEPVTMQLSEPDVKITMPSSHVNRQEPRLDLISARLLIIASVKPSMPPETSIK